MTKKRPETPLDKQQSEQMKRSSEHSISEKLQNEVKSTKRRTTHTTNPHQSKVGSRKTDDR